VSGAALVRFDAFRLCEREVKEAATLSARYSSSSRAAFSTLGDKFTQKYAELLTKEGFDLHMDQVTSSNDYKCEAGDVAGSILARRIDGKGAPRTLSVTDHPCTGSKVMVHCSCLRYAEYRESCRHVYALMGMELLLHPRWLKAVNNLSSPLSDEYVQSIRAEFDVEGSTCSRTAAVARISPFGAEVQARPAEAADSGPGDEEGGGDGSTEEKRADHSSKQLSAATQERALFQDLYRLAVERVKVWCRHPRLAAKAQEVLSTALSNAEAEKLMLEITPQSSRPTGSRVIPPSADVRSTGFSRHPSYSGVNSRRRKRKTTLNEEDDAEYEDDASV